MNILKSFMNSISILEFCILVLEQKLILTGRVRFRSRWGLEQWLVVEAAMGLEMGLETRGEQEEMVVGQMIAWTASFHLGSL